jgi:hypothetical protein
MRPIKHSAVSQSTPWLTQSLYTSGNNVYGKVRRKSICLRRIAYLHQFLLDAVIFEAYITTAHGEVGGVH